MKTLIVAMIGVASVLPALAGPDWQIIEHGRKVKAERMQAERAKQEQVPQQTDQHSQMMKDCMEMMKKS